MLSAVPGRIEHRQPWLAVRIADHYSPLGGEYIRSPFAGAQRPFPARVLLVEDERAVRAVVATFLKHAGYEILEADTPQQALAIVSDSTERFDLMLSDVVMPGMSGPALVDAVRAVRPTVRVILMSGYTDHSMLKSRGLDPTTPFLQKPFSPAALAKKVREVLES